MKELSRAEASDILEGTEDRVSGASLEELMSREDSPTTSGMRCWQGEVEVEDRWGISSPTSRSEGGAPSDRPSGALEKSKSRLHGSRRSLHRAGRRVFSCFRHSTISLVCLSGAFIWLYATRIVGNLYVYEFHLYDLS